MNKIIGVVLVVVALILLYFGYEAYNSPASDVSQALTGEPTDNSLLFLLSGAAVLIVGLYVVAKGK